MSRPVTKAHLVLALLIFSLTPTTAQANAARECQMAIGKAAQVSGVPKSILTAVAMTESGRQGPSGPEPWPWALNQAGESHWFQSKEEALTYLNNAILRGVTNIDVGCFQVNWRWHGEAFPSTLAMIDPLTNANYAASFLNQLYAQTGSWEKAVAGYHSFTPELADKYMKRFRPILASLETGAFADSTYPAERIRQNNYPLLQMGHSQTAGSLVSTPGSLAPLFGKP